MSVKSHSDIEKVATLEESGSILGVPSSALKWHQRLRNVGVESRGIRPIAMEDRTDGQYNRILFLWIAMSFNLLPFSAGTLGPIAFGLSVRDSCLVILFFNVLCCIPPAYFCTWGPKMGMRQMIQARFSFGKFGVLLPVVLNLIGMIGFCILSCILGGQTLAAVADYHLSWSVGVVIISLVSLLVSFMGYTVLHWYERLSWAPVIIAVLVALGTGGKHLSNPTPAAPATAQAVLSFASVMAGFVLTWSPLSSDFTCYMRPEAPSHRIFIYSYVGLLFPVVTLQCLGAAVAACLGNVASWQDGYDQGSVGGLLAAMLAPAHGFGKFLVVLLSLGLVGNVAATFYSVSLNFQMLMPFLIVVPRYIFSIIATAIVIPLSIVGAHHFYATLNNFLALIGYWASAFTIIILEEHFIFRGGKASSYDISTWNTARELPTGIASLGAGLLSLGLVVPSIDQVWFVGPIAKHHRRHWV
ncbi:hypothetical protein BS47DRAFT_1341452 [Hydnum rufescens UP504]|uniref:Purine-cytosine permease n=1 Tax=Hydnum rufescens UP504 TaxID=1448309 RepID=A0A9P6B1C2_9AGAM|nr:hypothetical protein BS47DRAFT_1341452 [Hydnum rufescens UP504]